MKPTKILDNVIYRKCKTDLAPHVPSVMLLSMVQLADKRCLHVQHRHILYVPNPGQEPVIQPLSLIAMLYMF